MTRAAWVAGVVILAVQAVVGAAARRACDPLPPPSIPPPGPPKTMRLTFDADMTPGMLTRLRAGRVAAWYDPAILDYLREHQLPATIFVTGLFADAYPDLISRLARDPLFAIGVHGYTHAAFTDNCWGLPALRTDAEKLDDLIRGRDAVARLTGRPPVLFRYPGLCHDAHDDALVRQAGLTVDTPDIVSGDAFSHDADAVVEQVLRLARSGGTVIFHLGGPNAPVTLVALERAVPALGKMGYEFTLR